MGLNVVLSLAVAVGSWIHVPGGNWQPSQEQIADARSKIEAYVSGAADPKHDRLSTWENYTFQYQGIEKDRRKRIFINAFCFKPPAYVERALVLIMDGGACLFKAYHDVDSKAFILVAFNGLG